MASQKYALLQTSENINTETETETETATNNSNSTCIYFLILVNLIVFIILLQLNSPQQSIQVNVTSNRISQIINKAKNKDLTIDDLASIIQIKKSNKTQPAKFAEGPDQSHINVVPI